MKPLLTAMLFLTMLPWVRDVRPCPQCYCGMQNWRSCSYFCYTREKGHEVNAQRPMTKDEKKTCTSMCPKMCERPKEGR